MEAEGSAETGRAAGEDASAGGVVAGLVGPLRGELDRVPGAGREAVPRRDTEVDVLGHGVLSFPPARRVGQGVGYVTAEAGHVESARVDLPVAPFQVADGALGAPAVGAADRGGGLDHREVLDGRPRVPAVALVLALPAVEPGVAVDRAGGAVVLVRRGRIGAVRLADDGVEHVAVAAAGVVGPAVAREVDDAVLGDAAGRERAGQGAVTVEDQPDDVRAGSGDGVVDHHTVHGAPWALVVAVVGAPAGDLVDGAALGLQRGDEPGGGERGGHESVLRSGAWVPV